MNNSNLCKIVFYSVFGLLSACIAWSVSYVLFDILDAFNLLSFIPSDIVLITFEMPFIASGIVCAEMFLGSPTRPKANWRILKKSFLIPILLIGLAAGLILSLLSWLLILSNIPSLIVRIVSWSLIGTFAGLAESLTWSTRSLEGTASTTKKRMQESITYASLGGFCAALLYELFSIALGDYAEFFGFLLLGGCVGFALYFATRPTHQFALRAGQGFEATKPKKKPPKSGLVSDIESDPYEPIATQISSVVRPEVKNSEHLQLFPANRSRHSYYYIEEGLSIQLPRVPNVSISIGSNPESDIFIPNIPEECALITLVNGEIELDCLCDDGVEIQRKQLSTGGKALLKHNQLVTLYHEESPDKFYRFVFYNRFLDPQS